MKKQRQNSPKAMMLCTVLFAISGRLNGYVAIRDGLFFVSLMNISALGLANRAAATLNLKGRKIKDKR